ncbi:MAG TPA: hypothetical protein VMH01_15260 [Puia sp.]|nr:hypothetical protein [Puia sp.]
MPNWKDQTQSIDKLRSQREELDQQLYNNNLLLQQKQDQLRQAISTNPNGDAQLEAEVKKLQAGIADDKNRLITAQKNVDQAITGLYGQVGPQVLVEQLPDNIPFALIPIRIETRFNIINSPAPQSPGNIRINSLRPADAVQSELWVRIYPDDISIITHEKTLTDQEVTQGENYWIAIFNAIKSGANAESQKQQAWSNLVSSFGATRSGWVALQTKPTNWTTDLTGINSPGQLVFPTFDLTKTQAWSRAPRTNTMPDHFVVMLFNGGVKVGEFLGNQVPDELIVGPDPMDASNSFVTSGNKLNFGSDFDWASDFDKAVSTGMGLKIPLTPQQANSGFDQLLVLGLILSKDEASSQQTLEDLIDNHHYAPQGFALMPQGMATKNTSQANSGFSKTDLFDSTSYVVETGDPLFSPADDCDGKNMADALGINYEPLQHVLYSDATDNREAMLLNTALYSGTLGYYVGSLLSPVLSPATQNELSDFFIRHITGRGPLPAFRVGNQPYGILLTSDFSSWKWNERETGYSNIFLQTLYNVLADYQKIWLSLLPQLQYAGKDGQDPLTVLTNILGLQPASASFAQRNAYSTENLINLDAFQYGGRYYKDIQNNFTSKNEGLAWLQSFGYDPAGPGGIINVPQILRLVYQYAATTLDPDNLVDKVPVTDSKPISDYGPIANQNYLNWLAAANSEAQLEQQDFGNGVQPPTSLLYLMLRKSLLQSLHSGSVNWFATNGVDFSATMATSNFFNIRPGGTLTKYEVMKAPLSTALPAHPEAKMAIADYLLGPGSNEPSATVPTSIKAALQELSTKHSAAIERCFIEHLDTLTYRLDAWQTAIFQLRLQQQRNSSAPAQPVNNQPAARTMGIYLGAYGWVEELRPSPRQIVPIQNIPAQLRPTDNSPVYQYADNGGLVQAPSINHASTAALLRGGYLTHADVSAPDTFTVNLSSNRVRKAIQILDGIRHGQTLEALLGYQFERGLHDRGSADNSLLRLNEYIYELRIAFPIQTNLVQQQAGVVQETIPATDVVNGLTLAGTTLPFPYGATGDITTASSAEQAAVEAERNNLSDTLDAIKDMMMTESVYQLVLGNSERASASINALQDGGIPPVLESIDTPRGNIFRFTNRVTIQFANGDPAANATNPWLPIPMTARSKMETGMNRWLGTLLGDPGSIAFQVSLLDNTGNPTGTLNMSVDQLQLQPLDLVYIAGMDEPTGAAQTGKENKTGASELETRIAYAYRKAKGIDDSGQISISFLNPQGLPGKKTLGSLLPMIKALKSLITDSRYLNAQDFTPLSANPLPDAHNPNRYDTHELTTRVNNLQVDYLKLLNDLQAISIDASVTDSSGTTTIYGNLGDLCAGLDAANLSFSDISFTFSNVNAVTLVSQMIRIANAAQGEAFPGLSSLTTDSSKQVVLDQARGMISKMIAANQSALADLTKAGGLTDPVQIVQTLVEAGRYLLEPAMTIIPVFLYNNESDILNSDADRAQLLSYATNTLNMYFAAEEWMQNAAHVRPRLARWDYIRTISEANNVSLPISPVQVPYKVKDSWLAIEFPATDPFDNTKPFTITNDTLSVAIHGTQAFQAGASHCGLLIDDWIEAIPTQEEITGITFNYNQPAAFPPQAILLTVSPSIKGHWTWNDLVNILTDTLMRAKLRAVEPQVLATANKVECSLLLPALLSNFTQFDLDIALDYRMNLKYVSEKMPVLNASEFSMT